MITINPAIKKIARGPDEWLALPVKNWDRAGHFVGQIEAREINGAPTSIRFPLVWCGAPGLSPNVWLERGAEGLILLAESVRLCIQDDQYGIALLGWTKQEGRMCAIFDHRDISGMLLEVKVWRYGFRWFDKSKTTLRVGVSYDGLPAARKTVLKLMEA